MAIMRICDRCGGVINPRESTTFLRMYDHNADMKGKETELCVSCVFQLKEWLKPLTKEV